MKAQEPTKAVKIENMNEAQLNAEIRKTERAIDRAEKTMNSNSVLNRGSERAMRDAFPLGAGGDGWSSSRRRQNSREISRNVSSAKKYTEAADKKTAAETRLQKLKDAKKQVQGTGKTQAKIRAEATKKAVNNTKTTMKWKTTQKGGWSNGGYSPKVIKSGNYEIHGSDGLYSVYKDGRRIGSTSKLSSAKSYVERDAKKR